MSRAICCDNCGSFFGVNKVTIKETINERPLYTTDANVLAFLVDNGGGTTLIKRFDICPECLKKLFEIMPGLISKEE